MTSTFDDAMPPLALTMGEPAGVGLDITLMAWAARRQRAVPPFYLLAGLDAIRRRADKLGLDVPVRETRPGDAAMVFNEALPVVPLEAPVKAEPGAPDPADAPAVIEAIERAVKDCRAGLASAVVTNPIHKKSLYDAGFIHPGHTEFLGVLADIWDGGPWSPVMMLAGPELRTVPITVHVPLAKVPEVLTTKLITDIGEKVANELIRRFGISAPRIAVAGLNPHAGESGSIGTEEADIIAPAISNLVAKRINAVGPLSADTLFHPEARRGYDAVLAMYHDQALIPVKTIAFDETVNVTLGLPFVRTSPDHGTAFDIAGTGKARALSLTRSLRLAGRLARADARAPA